MLNQEHIASVILLLLAVVAEAQVILPMAAVAAVLADI
jgi:hypothetical protein